MGRKPINRSDREKLQGRWFWCILYEDEMTEETLNRLSSFWDSFFYIRHDSDIWDEEGRDKFCIDHQIPLDCTDEEYNGIKLPVLGQPKKPHYHIVGFVSNPCILGRAAIKFGVKSQFVQRIEKSKKAIRYLLHLDEVNKHKYGIEELITNDEAIVQKYCGDEEMSVNEKARIILEVIERDYKCGILYLCQRFIDMGVYDEFRRGQHLYTSIIWELRNKEKEVKEK